MNTPDPPLYAIGYRNPLASNFLAGFVPSVAPENAITTSKDKALKFSLPADAAAFLDANRSHLPSPALAVVINLTTGEILDHETPQPASGHHGRHRPDPAHA
jgi:hypothetical protein